MYLGLNSDDAERIITHPDIYPLVSDDGSVPRETFTLHEGVVALVVYDPEPVACSIFHQTNFISVQIHTQTLPKYRKNSYRYGQAMLDWIWDNTPIMKITAMIPEDNRIALLYTLKLGFKVEGINRQSFMRKGKLMNQTHIGIQRR